MGGDPIARIEHIPGDLRLHGVDVVHQRRRADEAGEEGDRGKQEDN
jgi:hypothetical protein